MFVDAQQHNSTRQGYLDSLFATGRCPYASAFVYDPSGDLVIREQKQLNKKYGGKAEDIPQDPRELIPRNAAVPFVPCMMGKRERPKVFISDSLFKHSEAIAHRILFDHECIHARDVFLGMEVGGLAVNSRNIRLFDLGTINKIAEIRAHGAEIDKIGITLPYPVESSESMSTALLFSLYCTFLIDIELNTRMKQCGLHDELLIYYDETRPFEFLRYQRPDAKLRDEDPELYAVQFALAVCKEKLDVLDSYYAAL